MQDPQDHDEEHEQLIERVAAMDVAKASGMGCTGVPIPSVAGRRLTRAWEVEVTTKSIMELADQRIERGTVESTSDCWRGFCYLLEARGLSVMLANAREVNNVPGRPKIDPLDAVWLAKLPEGAC